MIQKVQGFDRKNGSSKLINPGKCFYLKLAGDFMREVRNARDKDGFSYCRKAMMVCGMALNLNEWWEVQQLFPHMHSILARFVENFNGTSGAGSLKLDRDVTESDLR